VVPSLIGLAARIACAAMKSASLTSPGWAIRVEIAHACAWFHRVTPIDAPTDRRIDGLSVGGCRFQTCRPV
jgi:hypothetical protein